MTDKRFVTKTQQIALCEGMAEAGRLHELCWLGACLSKNQTMGIPATADSPPIVPVVPIVEQDQWYDKRDWRDWFDYSRVLAQIMCKAGSRHNFPLEFVPAVGEYTKFAQIGWKIEIWHVFDTICPFCGGIWTILPVFDTNLGKMKQICRFCLEELGN